MKKPVVPQEPVIIRRSTAKDFPLPSVVPSVQVEKLQTTPVAETVEAQPAIETQPAPENPAPGHRSGSRKHAIPHEKLTGSWAESLSQRVLSTLGHTRPARTSISGIKPVSNKAEVSYNPQGKIDYVTYTINAPERKSRGRSR